MSYNFNFAVSAAIDVKTVENMIKHVVEEQTGRKVKSVTFNIKGVTKGWRDEYTEATFSGVTVLFEDGGS